MALIPYPVKPSITEMIGHAKPQAPEPNFMNQQEAVLLAQELFNDMGIATEPKACYPLNGDTIQSLASLNQSQFGGNKADYNTYPECYVIHLSQKLMDTTVCSGESIELEAGDAMSPGVYATQPTIQVVITKDGVYEMMAYSCVEVGKLKQSELNLLSMEQAGAVIQKSYENVINTDPLTVSNLTLQYVVLPKSLQDDSLQLWPTWVCRIEQDISTNTGRSSATGSGTITETLFVDAVNGQMIKERYQ